MTETPLSSSLVDLKERARELPLEPGCYLFKDQAGRVLYVGKAKLLRKRVLSYFSAPARQTPKTRSMLGLARGLDILQTGTEKEALLLEASLIKKHRPRYNIVLRDDKQYVLFRLDKNADYPRLTLTRKVQRDGALYFGPFTSALAARAAWKAIHRVFPLRRCTDRTLRNRVRPCLYHHIQLCLAPCVLDVPPEEYGRMVRRVELLLTGRSAELTRQLREEMHRASEALEFEKAADLRDQLRAVEQTLEQQTVVLPDGGDMDVLGLAAVSGDEAGGESANDAGERAGGLALGVLFVRKGRLLDKRGFFWPGLSLEDGREVLEGFLGQYYGQERFIPERVLLPWELEDSGEDTECVQDGEGAPRTRALLAQILSERRGGAVRIAPPRSNAEKQLVAMAAANARERARENARTSEDRGKEPLLESLSMKLGLPKPPLRLEAVDISHHAGEQTRAGMVVFEHGEPRTEQYRVYTLPEELPGGDDYAALAAWAVRRLESGPPWPDLLLVDGGKGQLAAVHAALERAGQAGLFPLASIAKERVRTPGARSDRRKPHGLRDSVYLPGRKNPLPLKPGSPELLFLQHVRDTVHNFAIGRHRRARRTAVLGSELLRLPGVGPKTARLLWERFPSLEAMTAAGLEDLLAIPGLGAKRAAALHKQLQSLKG